MKILENYCLIDIGWDLLEHMPSIWDFDTAMNLPAIQTHNGISYRRVSKNVLVNFTKILYIARHFHGQIFGIEFCAEEIYTYSLEYTINKGTCKFCRTSGPRSIVFL